MPCWRHPAQPLPCTGQGYRIQPWLGLPIVGTWMVVLMWKRLWAVLRPRRVCAGACIWRGSAAGHALETGQFHSSDARSGNADFTWHGFVSVAIPLFVVTMASQNIPASRFSKSMATSLRPVRCLPRQARFRLVAALFGAVPVNLAAITAPCAPAMRRIRIQNGATGRLSSAV